MSFVHSALSRHAPKRFVFRTFAIARSPQRSSCCSSREPRSPSANPLPRRSRPSPHGDGVISVAFVAPADNGSAITVLYGQLHLFQRRRRRVRTTTPHRRSSCRPLTTARPTRAPSARRTRTVPAPLGRRRRRRFLPRPPDTPSSRPLLAGNAQISVAFVAHGDTAARSPASPRHVHRATVALPGQLSGATSPIVVTGLTNGKSYTCTVLATNAEGNSAPEPAARPPCSRHGPDRAGAADGRARQREHQRDVHRVGQQRRLARHRLHRELHVE